MHEEKLRFQLLKIEVLTKNLFIVFFKSAGEILVTCWNSQSQEASGL